MKSNSTIKPDVLSDREKDGSRLYSYNIVEVTKTDEDGNEVTGYDYDQVRVYEPISANKILAAVIADAYDQSYELKLVNEYNAAINGLYDDDTAEEKKTAYTSYLTTRAALKDQVDADCEELGIKQD